MFTFTTQKWFLLALLLPVLALGCSPRVPASTPTPQLVVAETKPAIQSYVSYVQPKIAAAGQNLGIMGSLTDRFAKDPTLYKDSNWQYQMKHTLDIIRSNGEALQRVPDLPPEAARLDAMLAEIGRDLVYIADEMQAGINTMNATRIQSAVTRMQAMNAKLPAATAEIKTLTSK